MMLVAAKNSQPKRFSVTKANAHLLSLGLPLLPKSTTIIDVRRVATLEFVRDDDTVDELEELIEDKGPSSIAPICVAEEKDEDGGEAYNRMLDGHHRSIALINARVYEAHAYVVSGASARELLFSFGLGDKEISDLVTTGETFL